MATLDDLIGQVSDPELRTRLKQAARDIRSKQRFGLVFEEHIPETAALSGLTPEPGALVQDRKDPSAQLYRLEALEADQASVVPAVDGGEASMVPTADLLVVKRFGEPIYPALSLLGSLDQGETRAPHHLALEGENFHLLQLLRYLYRGQVDCIYIDPPYNTGARDWKYNNHYVDGNDAWRHSKWLSMMEKRLRLAKLLLRPDGVLIVTIDEHELHHLGMLLERLFPSHLRYSVSAVINPKGSTGTRNFGVVDEQVIFCVPDVGEDIICRQPLPDGDDDGEWDFEHLRRRGGATSYRHQRPKQFYPIFIDEKAKEVVRVGEFIPLEKEPDYSLQDGLRPIWPVDTDGNHRAWRFSPKTMHAKLVAGDVVLGRYNKKKDTWTLNLRVPKKTTRRLRTVWWDSSHDAGTHGTELLKKQLGEPGLFPFPKSLYAVRDALAAVVIDRPDALILDFFAGSGTTFNATCLLNAEDGGSRRCILLTNNEVDAAKSKELAGDGAWPGDAEYERWGIFERVTRPRCEAVVTGKTPNGEPIKGDYMMGRAISDGFKEAVDFLRLSYLDPDSVELGQQFAAIHPALWAAAGGVGPCPTKAVGDVDYILPEASTYGVLFSESAFREFRSRVDERAGTLTHVWLVTNSEEAFAEMRAALPRPLRTSMLYRDYLMNFEINGTRFLR